MLPTKIDHWKVNQHHLRKNSKTKQPKAKVQSYKANDWLGLPVGNEGPSTFTLVYWGWNFPHSLLRYKANKVKLCFGNGRGEGPQSAASPADSPMDLDPERKYIYPKTTKIRRSAKGLKVTSKITCPSFPSFQHVTVWICDLVGCSLHVWHMWKHVPCPTHSSKLHLLPHCSHCQHAQSKRCPSTTNKQRPRCQVGLNGPWLVMLNFQNHLIIKNPPTSVGAQKRTFNCYIEWKIDHDTVLWCHFPKQMPKTLMEAQVAKSQDAMAEKSKPSQAVNCGRQGTL